MSARPLLRTAAFCATALCALPAALAAQKDAAIPLTFSVPEAPAFTFLGVSPTKVTRASNARDLGAALVNGIDSTGRVLTGVAVGATLWTLLPAVRVPLASYRANRAAFALANTQLSLGSARAAGEGANTDVALGLRTTLVDRSDPMLNAAFVRSLTGALARCVSQIAQPALPAPNGAPAATADTTPDAALACADAASERLRADWFARRWNSAALSAGVGTGWRLPRSELTSPDALGGSAWLTGALPVGRAGQLLAQVQYDHRGASADSGGADLVTYGARVVRGSSQYTAFAELAGTQRLSAARGVSRSNVQWSGGLEFEVAPTYWLSAGFGKRYAAQGRPDRVALIANVRWGVSGKARLRSAYARAP